MVYNRGIYVKTHPLVLDMEEDVSAEDFIETYDDTEVLVTFVDMPVHQIGKQTVEFVVENKKGRSKKYTQTLEWAVSYTHLKYFYGFVMNPKKMHRKV